MAAETILVVDDAREIRELVADIILRPSGYTILQAESGAEALETAARQRPDLIISDIKMPGVTGLDLARAVQQEWPGLPVILITAEGSEEIAQQALRAGVADYFIKPFDPDDLLRAVTRALARRVPAPAPAGGPEGEALLQHSRALAAELELERVGVQAAAAAAALTGAASAQLWLPDEAGQALSVRGSYPAESGPFSQPVPAAGSLPGQVLSSGQPVLAGGPEAELAPGVRVGAFLGVPVHGAEKVLGVLSVTQPLAGPALPEQAGRALDSLAGYTAAALENARRYAEVQAERRRLYAVLHEIADSVIVLDGAGRLVLLNQAGRDLFKVTRLNVIGQPLAEVVPHLELAALLENDRRSGEITLEDGRTLSVFVSPIATVGRAVVLHDITHLKELDRLKSEFVTTVSHDLRSPLTSILAYVSLMERVGPLNERQQEFMARARDNVQAMTALLTELLDLGQIEAGLDAQKEPLHIGGLVHRLVEERLIEARARSQALQVRVAPNLPLVLINAARLRQLLANLIDNALKYTPERGLIQVEVYPDGGFVILTVSDNGIGIPPADLPYIFDKFFRAGNTRGQYPGTGLGLAIVKSIIDQHGGRIWAHSQAGEGTTFTVMLPIAAKPA